MLLEEQDPNRKDPESLDDNGSISSIANSQYATSNIFPTGTTENRYKKSIL